MLKNLLHRVIPSLAQFRENRTKKKYEKKKQAIYSRLEAEKQQRLYHFLKANKSIREE